MTGPAALMQYSTRNSNSYGQLLSIVDRIKVLVQNFVHSEHVDFVLLEHLTHWLIANDISLV